MKPVSLFKYQGAKTKFVPKFLELTRGLTTEVFVEPFVGSGAVFLNTEDKYDEYIINDLNSDVVRMWRSVKESSYEDYLDAKNYVLTEFGDLKTDKEAFYGFRNWWNKTYWKTNTTEEGIYLSFLTNSVINSILRFGPNGMNSCFGKRWYFPEERDFLVAKEKLEKTTIKNQFFHEVSIPEFSTIFLDPPYLNRPSGAYVKDFEHSDLVTFTNKVQDLSHLNTIIYTDTENPFIEGFNKFVIRKMRNTAPGSSKSETENEYCYYNFEEPESLLEY